MRVGVVLLFYVIYSQPIASIAIFCWLYTTFFKACRVVPFRILSCLVSCLVSFYRSALLASDRHRFNIERFSCYGQFMACYLSGFVLIRKSSSHCLYAIVPHEQNLYNEATAQSQLKWHIRRLHQSYLYKNELTKVNSNLWSMPPEHPCVTPFWKHAQSHVFSLFVSFKPSCLFA